MIPWKTWDVWILFSWVNTKLRDRYDSLATLCEEEQIDRNDLETTLRSVGCRYDESLSRFVIDRYV